MFENWIKSKFPKVENAMKNIPSEHFVTSEYIIG
jgi:hypothetical protein